jgi:nicotinamidase-related amidase
VEIPMMMMNAQTSTLLIVDVQENLGPVMADPRSVYRGCSLLLRAAARRDIPVIVSEQYPKGLGPTMGELLELAPAGAVVGKIHFSCAAEPAIMDRLTALNRRQVVVAGIEAHVCVLQTVLGLQEAGYEVFVVADACSSRQPANHQAAMERLRQAGAGIVTVEMVVFEWLHRAETPEFKDLLRLIK